MISVGWRILSGIVDVGVVALKQWGSGYFSAYICWLDGGF